MARMRLHAGAAAGRRAQTGRPLPRCTWWRRRPRGQRLPGEGPGAAEGHRLRRVSSATFKSPWGASSRWRLRVRRQDPRLLLRILRLRGHLRLLQQRRLLAPHSGHLALQLEGRQLLLQHRLLPQRFQPSLHQWRCLRHNQQGGIRLPRTRHRLALWGVVRRRKRRDVPRLSGALGSLGAALRWLGRWRRLGRRAVRLRAQSGRSVCAVRGTLWRPEPLTGRRPRRPRGGRTRR